MLRSLHANEERRALDRAVTNSPCVLGHPMPDVSKFQFPTGHVDMRKVREDLRLDPSNYPFQEELIARRQQEIVEKEVAEAKFVRNHIQNPGMVIHQREVKATQVGTKFQEGLKIAKAPNPKQAYGDKKPPVHLIHQIAELHESAALHGGRRKYGENNYIQTPVEAMTYVGAILRHVKAWASGERVDAKELVHHLGAVKACCTILLTAEATGMLIDNRVKTGHESVSIGACRPATYREATAEAFAEVEATIEHLNKLYPPFQG